MKKCIYAAKININQNIFRPDFGKLIPLLGEAIKKSGHIIYETKKLKWTFVNVEEIEIDNEIFIVGKLCKIRKKTEEKKFDEKTHDTYICEEENVARESVFLLDVNDEMLVMEDHSEIDKRTFIQIFEKLCYLSDSTLGEIKIEFYPKSFEIDQLLFDVEKIYYAKFNVIPANHTSKNGFKKLDETLKEEKIRQLNITLKNDDGDISKDNDSIFCQCIEMVKSAYGSCKINVKYKNNKKRKSIDSECTLYKKSIDFVDNIKEYTREFKKLIDSIKKDRIL